MENTILEREIGRLWLALDTFIQSGKSKVERPYANNTRIRKETYDIHIRLHETDVISINLESHKIKLDSGGWRTATTKERINRVINQIGLDIYQEKSEWFIRAFPYITYNSPTEPLVHPTFQDAIPYFDGMVIPDDILSPKNTKKVNKQIKDRKAMIKRINSYCRAYKKALDSLKVDQPGPGDCWYCAMKDKGGSSLGDLTKDSEHLLAHMEDNYFVPSLAINAMAERGRNAVFCWNFWYGGYKEGKLNNGSPSSDLIVSDIRHYLKKRLLKY